MYVKPVLPTHNQTLRPYQPKNFAPSHNFHINTNIIVLQTIHVAKGYKKLKINFCPLATLLGAVIIFKGRLTHRYRIRMLRHLKTEFTQ
jgi:hypothetical protein